MAKNKVAQSIKKTPKLDFEIRVPTGSRSLAMSKETVKQLIGQNSNQAIADFEIEEVTDEAGKKSHQFVIHFV